MVVVGTVTLLGSWAAIMVLPVTVFAIGIYIGG